ncbi:MAG: hypothetical protein FJ304_08585, partial [Planctomycetes bacterium]|nr:hypothetical protein [Planctomycetota bacterium]
MFWVRKVFAPVALVFGIVGTTALVMADGQPPFGKGGFQPPFGKGGQPGDKKGEKKDGQPGDKKVEEKKGGQPGQPGDKKGGPRPDAAVDAWVKVLIEKITDPHDTVRESARGALVGVGPAALPALQRLADGDDSAKAVAARKLIGAIQGQGRGPGQPGQPGQPGRGPGGPGM